MLREISVNEISEKISQIMLNEKLVSFIKEHRNRCYIVTGNLDVWIEKLVSNMGMEWNIFCSKAVEKDGYIQDIFSIADKHAVIWVRNSLQYDL